MNKQNPPRDLKDYRARKLALRDKIRRDTALTKSYRLIGEEIIQRSFEATGCTDSVQWFVKVLKVSERTVAYALKALEARGYIRVERAKGRNNVIFPVLPPQNLRWSGSDTAATIASGGIPVDRRLSEGTPAKNDANQRKTYGGAPAENDALIPSPPFSQNPLEGEFDGESEASAMSRGHDVTLAKSLALKIAEIAGLSPHLQWPLYWTHAADVVAGWLQRGWSPEIILAGVRQTMQRKRDAGPPNSIDYFEPQIRSVAALGGQRADYQRCLNEIAGLIGWDFVTDLGKGKVDDIVALWSRGELKPADLHKLKGEIAAQTAKAS